MQVMKAGITASQRRRRGDNSLTLAMDPKTRRLLRLEEVGSRALIIHKLTQIPSSIVLTHHRRFMPEVLQYQLAMSLKARNADVARINASRACKPGSLPLAL